MSISAKYTPAEIESKWYEYWESNGFFTSVPDERPSYTVVIPPPNVTGVLHMGHILNNTIQDILVRRKRMEGFNACWVPGMDHASIATEAKVVKLLRTKGIKKSDLSREEFLKHAFEWKEKYGGIILQQLRRLGASCDWDRTRFTMDDDYYEAVIKTFVDLHEKGHIYRGLRMVNWDPAGRTALSDEEVIYREVHGHLYHVKYKIEGTEDEWVTIATTRPETILGDSAITVHPEDDRYKHLVGKKALVPLINRAIPIIADDYVDREFGTGCLKVTPAHDTNDYEIGERHNLPVIDVLNEDGTMSEAAQLYIGEDRFVVRKKIKKDLDAAGHLVEVKDYHHSVGHSERTDAVIEPRLSLQWWLRMGEFSKPAYKAVMEDTVKLIPAKFKNTYRHWMENIRDWCISRQLWWGHQIPAWYLASEKDLPEEKRQFFVAEKVEGAIEKANAATGQQLSAEDLIQDADVLDTWFSSWLWPFQVFKGLTDPGNEELKYYYPTNDLVTGPDILFFWVARMIIAGYEYEGERPFNNVYLTGLIRDQLGRKMSKSLGNSPDALDLMSKYGTDGVRVGILLSSPAGGDLIFDTPIDVEKDGLESKLCTQGRNFANKIWNAFRLVHMWETDGSAATNIQQVSTTWIEARINEVKGELETQFEQFRISDALMTNYKLIWDDFCSWYLELMKPAQGAKMGASTRQKVLELFGEILKLAHPFIPFITEEIWQTLDSRKKEEALIISQLTKSEARPEDKPMLKDFALIQETVTAIRALRASKGLPNKDAIELWINSDNQDVFQRYASVLNRFLNLSKLDFTSDPLPASATTQVGTHEFFVPLGENMDVEGEIKKLKEEIEYTEGFLNKVLKKLSNERFVQNAPANVVDMERKKQADAEQKLSKLKESLASLEN